MISRLISLVLALQIGVASAQSKPPSCQLPYLDKIGIQQFLNDIDQQKWVEKMERGTCLFQMMNLKDQLIGALGNNPSQFLSNLVLDQSRKDFIQAANDKGMWRKFLDSKKLSDNIIKKYSTNSSIVRRHKVLLKAFLKTNIDTVNLTDEDIGELTKIIFLETLSLGSKDFCKKNPLICKNDVIEIKGINGNGIKLIKGVIDHDQQTMVNAGLSQVKDYFVQKLSKSVSKSMRRTRFHRVFSPQVMRVGQQLMLRKLAKYGTRAGVKISWYSIPLTMVELNPFSLFLAFFLSPMPVGDSSMSGSIARNRSQGLSNLFMNLNKNPLYDLFPEKLNIANLDFNAENFRPLLTYLDLPPNFQVGPIDMEFLAGPLKVCFGEEVEYSYKNVPYTSSNKYELSYKVLIGGDSITKLIDGSDPVNDFESSVFLGDSSGSQKGMELIFIDDVVADLGENLVQEFTKMIVKSRPTNPDLKMRQDLSNVLNSNRIQRLALMFTVANNIIRLDAGLPILKLPVCTSCEAIGLPDATRVGP